MEFIMQTTLSLTLTLSLSSVGKTHLASSLTLLKEIFGKNGLGFYD